MSTYELLSLIIQVVGILAVIWSLVYIGKQTKQANEQAKLATVQAELNAIYTSLGYMSAIDQIFVDHPDMYPYFYEGKPMPEDKDEYYKVITVAMAVTNHLEATLEREGAPTEKWWDRYMHDQFKLSPVLCEYLKTRKDWFDERLFNKMEQALVDQAPGKDLDSQVDGTDAAQLRSKPNIKLGS